MAAGDKAYWSDIANTIDPPMGTLAAVGTQSLADNTAVAITYGSGSEVLDTHGQHDPTTNPTRITPNVPGYYDITVTTFFGSRTDYSNVNSWVRTNGANNLAPAQRNGYNGIATASVQSQQTRVEHQPFNGTTDYFEHMAQQDNIANAAQITNQSGQYTSVCSWRYVAPL